MKKTELEKLSKLTATLQDAVDILKEFKTEEKPYAPKQGDVIYWSWKKSYGGAETLAIIDNYPNAFVLCCKNAYGFVHAGKPDLNLPLNIEKGDIVRPATDEEKQLLFDKMHENGKDFDFEKMELVDYKWRAEKNEDYYSYSLGKIIRFKEYGRDMDDINFEIGNYFKTEAEAEAFREYCLNYKK